MNPSNIRIYIVDDELTIRVGIALALQHEFQIQTFEAAEAAIEDLTGSAQPPDLVLLDIGLPGMNGVDALRIMKAMKPDLQVIMITAYEDVDTAVTAMKLGAYDYVIKPLQMESLTVTINNALDSLRLHQEVQALQEQFLLEHHPYFVGESDAIIEVMDLVKQVAASPDTTILILGETGTGKELVADTIHFRSPNFKGPLVKVNCASFPRNLIESELFGYESGAFSGAKKGGKKGLIEQAESGTLFLDEIADLSFEAQSKLLRFLENGEFYRLGGTKLVRVQARVVAATNQDLEAMIAEGRFRKDLYYRLGVIKVRLPSLAERPADILPFARYFLAFFSKKFNKHFRGFSDEAEKALLDHPWGGNVRELKNCLQRGVLMGCGSELTCLDLGLKAKNRTEEKVCAIHIPQEIGDDLDLPALLHRIEKSYLEQALEKAGGNESAAARILNMNHHTFRYRWRKLHGLQSGEQ